MNLEQWIDYFRNYPYPGRNFDNVPYPYRRTVVTHSKKGFAVCVETGFSYSGRGTTLDQACQNVVANIEKHVQRLAENSNSAKSIE